MNPVPTILRSSRSWSSSTQRSEYNKYPNAWTGLKVGIDNLNSNYSESTDRRLLNIGILRNCYKNPNVVKIENYKNIHENLNQSCLVVDENKVSKHKEIQSGSADIYNRTCVPSNSFNIREKANIVMPCKSECSRYGTTEAEGMGTSKNIPPIINKELMHGLGHTHGKLLSSSNIKCPQLVPISYSQLIRTTSFVENKKSSFNYKNNISSFLPDSSRFVSERYKSNNLRHIKHISYCQEMGYSSNNLPKIQWSINSPVNQENSSKSLNKKPLNPKIANFVGSNLAIMNLTRTPINPTINLEPDSNCIDININSVKLLSLLGVGSTSFVYSAFWRGTEVAMKILGNSPNNIVTSKGCLNLSVKSLGIDQRDSQRYLEFKNEIRIMRLLRHPNIVQFMGGNVNSNPPFLICEFCSGGTLFNLLHGVSKKCIDSNNYSFSGPSINLSLFQRIKILQDIAKGIHFLHSASPPIIHRDIKSLNVFLSQPVNSRSDIPIAKVGDFGLCQQSILNKGFANRPGNLVGTYQWMAPEVLTNQTYNEYIDVYSFGMIMYEVFSNKTPFFELGVDVNPETLADEIIRGIRPTLKYIIHDTPSEIRDIMMRCWDQSPTKRGTMLIIINELQCIMERLINSKQQNFTNFSP
ncbi:putative protein Roco7 [Cryptosporidium canis]|nr:putative protein Roco7 [Cryptosporidium canis]